MKRLLLFVVLLFPQYVFGQYTIIADETNNCSIHTDSLNPRAPKMLEQVVCTPLHPKGREVPLNSILTTVPPFQKDDQRRFEFILISDGYELFIGGTLKWKGDKNLDVLLGLKYTIVDTDGY